jgi:hypothetical protein
MTKCSNPDCTRNHEIEVQIAHVVESASRQVANLLGGGPIDAIYGMAAALTTVSFYTSLPGREKEAGEDLIELVTQYVEQMGSDEEALAKKRDMDATNERETRGTANGLPI